MSWRSGSFARSVMSKARGSFRSSPRLCPPPRPHSRRFFTNPRNLGALGGAQSLMPLYNVLAGARLTDVSPRAYSELSHGTFCRTCPDR